MSQKPFATSERASRIEPLTRLATGGMADIWLSREVGAAGMERLVVVKRLLPHLAREPEIVDMFVSEARFVARLVHPNVVQIHDLGEDEEGYFLVMEYVAGCSVSELLKTARERPMTVPLAAALSVTEQACRGAHAAHELCDPTGKPLGLVHRDISPHNLMIGPSGEVKLLDFGIAKATEAAEATRTGALKGKHGYMSPEQCAVSHLDRRSDVFALGIVCWELLTGARLFKRETEYATMHAIVSGDFPAPSTVRPDLPEGFDGVLQTALAVDPDERFQTADAFRRALMSVAEDCGIRPSRDDLVATMTALLGVHLEERERSLREAAGAGVLRGPSVVPEAASHSEGSGRSGTGVADDVATVVQRRPPSQGDEAEGDDEAQDATRTQTRPAAPETEVTLLDAQLGVPALEEPSSSDASVDAPSPSRAYASPEHSPSRGSRRLWIAAALGLAALAGAALALVSLGSSEDASPAATSAPSPAALSGPPLRFVIAPTVDPTVIQSELEPFLRWLERKVGRPVELAIAESYDATGDALAAGRADFGLLPPLLFVRALAREPGLQPLTVRLFDGSRASDGYLLVRDDSPLAQASDLRGHRICYVDKASTTGFLLPRVWMRKAGLVPDRDMQPIISGDHIAAMRDLASGKCDVAAVYSGAFLTARQEGIAVGRLRVLAITGRVPQDVMVAAPDMSPPDVTQLRAALLGFEPHRDIDAGRIGNVLGITGFAAFQIAELDAIREAAESEGLVRRPDAGAPE